MSAAATAPRREKLHRRGLVLEWFTVAWNVIEGLAAPESFLYPYSDRL